MLNIAKSVLDLESKALILAKQNLNNDFLESIKLISECKGKVVVTGVGKSGLVGLKISATLSSTGTASFFLHPTEAMHGDLGMISKDDIVLAISYSGETSELLSILPHLKRLNIPLISMTRSKDSQVASFAKCNINISVEKEACPLNAAPTTSTTLTMALGDALAVCLMEKRGFKESDFASFHPGGSLGKRLFVKIKDLMQAQNLPLISPQTSVKDAITIMSEKRLGCAILVENDKLCGIFSDGDLRRAIVKSDFSLLSSVKDFANLTPKFCDDENILASEILQIIEKSKIQLLVITDKNSKIKGVIHLHKLVEAGIK